MSTSIEAPAPLLKVDRLGVGIDTDAGLLRAVQDLDFELADGETLALVGESGCGKSLTAAALMRLLPEAASVTQGSVRFDDGDLLRLPEARMRHIRGRRIGMIFQDPSTALNPVLRIGAQLVEAIETHTDLRGAAARARAVDWLDRVGIPDPAVRFHDHPHRFSGGQQQRVMIAIALAAEPSVLIADEPTSALDTTVQAQILGLLRALQRQRGLAVLLVTHDLGVVAAMADRVALVIGGRIVETAAVHDFLATPRHPYARALLRSLPDADVVRSDLFSIPGEAPALSVGAGGCAFAARCDHAASICSTVPPRRSTIGRTQVWCGLYDGTVARPEERLAEAPSRPGRSAPFVHAAPPELGQRPLLQVVDLRVVYRPGRAAWHRIDRAARPAVDGLSLSLHAGDSLALIGESGSGKTSVGKAILQLLRGEAQVDGRVLLDGVDLLALRGEALRRARRDVQMVFQDPAGTLDPRMCAGDTLDEAMRALRPEWNAGERARRRHALMAQVHLPPDTLERQPHALSGGQRQRIAIARALCVEPRLLVCDEPTSALDVSVRAQVLGLLRRLQRTSGMGCLVITHDLAVVRQLARSVAVMDGGRIACQGTVDAVFSDPRPALAEQFWQAAPRLPLYESDTR